jgi:hypothetical protein
MHLQVLMHRDSKVCRVWTKDCRGPDFAHGGSATPLV